MESASRGLASRARGEARARRSALLAFALLPALACSGGGGAGTGQPPVLTSVTIAPESASVAKGLTYAFSATAHYSDGAAEDVTQAAQWASNDEHVATVSNEAGTRGVARGGAQGTAIVEAAFGGMSGRASLTVTPAVVVAISLSPANAVIATGTTQQYGATAIYSDTTREDVTARAEWASSGPAATVAAGGIASGETDGLVSISATFSGVTGSTPLTVTAATLESIEVSPSASTLPRGFQQAFTAAGVFSDGRKQDLTTQVTWTTSDPSIATISDAVSTKGLASGVASGTATITATMGTVAGSTSLTVTNAILSAIDVSPASATIAAGTALALSAMGTFDDGSILDLTRLVAWTSADPGVATISDRGVVLAVAPGTTTFTARYGDVSDTAVLTVTDATLQSIVIGAEGVAAGAPLVVPQGLSVQLTATGVFSDQTTQDLTALVSWSTSDPAVATVSNGDGTEGTATSLSAGTVTVTAGFLGIVGATQLTVPNATLDELVVTPASASLPQGFSLQFTATAMYSDGSSYDVTALATWSSSEPGFATISNAAGTQGLASGLATGTTTISATLAHAVGSTSLAVTNASLDSISIEPPSFTVAVGATRQLYATGHFSDGTTLDLTRQCQWLTSARKKALVSKTGLVTGRAPGVATITARKQGKQAAATATVN